MWNKYGCVLLRKMSSFLQQVSQELSALSFEQVAVIAVMVCTYLLYLSGRHIYYDVLGNRGALTYNDGAYNEPRDANEYIVPNNAKVIMRDTGGAVTLNQFHTFEYAMRTCQYVERCKSVGIVRASEGSRENSLNRIYNGLSSDNTVVPNVGVEGNKWQLFDKYRVAKSSMFAPEEVYGMGTAGAVDV